MNVPYGQMPPELFNYFRDRTGRFSPKKYLYVDFETRSMCDFKNGKVKIYTKVEKG